LDHCQYALDHLDRVLQIGDEFAQGMHATLIGSYYEQLLLCCQQVDTLI